VSLTDRDRKIVMVVAPLVLILAYWFLMLAPKREEAATAATELATQQQRVDAAQQRVDALDSDRTDFAADYAELVRLGKAVPAHVDMPTLLVQLESAAAGTSIAFNRIAAEERQASAPAATAAPPPAPGSGDGSQPAAAGGEPAQSGAGSAAETAGNTVTGANANSAAVEQSGVSPTDTQTSESARNGALPIGGGTATPDGTTTSASTGAPGLDTVPLSLDFSGNFFDLAAFFHRLKRYVETSENDILVRGRLMTVEAVEFKSDAESFPKVSATLTANVYLAPLNEGTTAGAAPTGPGTTPALVEQPADGSVAPTATATPR